MIDEGAAGNRADMWIRFAYRRDELGRGELDRRHSCDERRPRHLRARSILEQPEADVVGAQRVGRCSLELSAVDSAVPTGRETHADAVALDACLRRERRYDNRLVGRQRKRVEGFVRLSDQSRRRWATIPGYGRDAIELT